MQLGCDWVAAEVVRLAHSGKANKVRVTGCNYKYLIHLSAAPFFAPSLCTSSSVPCVLYISFCASLLATHSAPPLPSAGIILSLALYRCHMALLSGMSLRHSALYAVRHRGDAGSTSPSGDGPTSLPFATLFTFFGFIFHLTT